MRMVSFLRVENRNRAFQMKKTNHVARPLCHHSCMMSNNSGKIIDNKYFVVGLMILI